MNATHPSTPPRQVSAPRRRMTRLPRQPHYSFKAVVSETAVKLLVNGVLCTAAIAGLVQLLPYQMSQQAKLLEIQRELARTNTRVDQLRSDFSRSFDPSQAKNIMQEQSYRVDPTQRSVVWQDSSSMEP